MGKEYATKSFKSGNSVAIRMPAALGILPDREWSVTEVDGELVIRAKKAASPRIDLTGIYGSKPGLSVRERSDRIIESRGADWAGKQLARD